MLKIDKQLGNVAFNEQYHKYFDVTDPDRKLISVTTLLGKLHYFDKEYWLNYKSVERLMDGGPEWKAFKDLVKGKAKARPDDTGFISVGDIKSTGLDLDVVKATREAIAAEWKAKSDSANEFGTKYHLDEENMLYNDDKKVDFSDEKFSKFELLLSGSFDCEKNNFCFDDNKRVMPELLISYDFGKLYLAGQSDLVIKDGDRLLILDHKTNLDKIREERASPFKNKLLEPCSHLRDNDETKYALQLSTYAYMLQKIYPHLSIQRIALFAYSRTTNDFEIINLKYMKDDVHMMIEYFNR